MCCYYYVIVVLSVVSSDNRVCFSVGAESRSDTEVSVL